MNNIPPWVKREILADHDYTLCMRADHHGHVCAGRITFEHAIIHAGSQLQEKFAILSICAYGHSVDQYQDSGDLNKEIHLWIALNRATESQLKSISKAENYIFTRDRLNKQYGKWKMNFPRPWRSMGTVCA